MSEKILVPVLGESITEATVSKWLKSEGDSVEADEPIVELETDKVNLEVPSPVTGVLIKINSKDGSTVEVGAHLGSVSENEAATKKSEGEQTVGLFIGKDKTYGELEDKQSDKEINQATAILRNAIANEGKQLVSIDTIDRTKTGERYGTKNNNAVARYTNIKVKPNINVSMKEKDYANIISRDIKIDPITDLINH